MVTTGLTKSASARKAISCVLGATAVPVTLLFVALIAPTKPLNFAPAGDIQLSLIFFLATWAIASGITLLFGLPLWITVDHLLRRRSLSIQIAGFVGAAVLVSVAFGYVVADSARGVAIFSGLGLVAALSAQVVFRIIAKKAEEVA